MNGTARYGNPGAGANDKQIAGGVEPGTFYNNRMDGYERNSPGERKQFHRAVKVKGSDPFAPD